MADLDVLVVGGGISGASFAFHAARARKSVLVVERDEWVGGCLASQRTPSGFWYELGAHTAYNSYGAFLELLEGCGLLGQLLARGKPVLRFLEGERLVPGKNLYVLLKLLGKGELLRSIPGWLGPRQEGRTVRAYYSRFVGPKNYERVLGPMLSAVPSQEAGDFPADMLFKKRPRRRDVVRSYTLPGGLRTAVEQALARPGIETRSGRTVVELERLGDGGFAATLDDGAHVAAGVLALAVSPSAAARLLQPIAPELSRAVAELAEARVESLGFAVRADRVRVPYATFLIPRDDAFHSVVTRDVVPDPEWRGFTFHFRPGWTREGRIERAAQVLGIHPRDMEALAERTALLPSPRLGHHQRIAELDRRLAGGRLVLTGNWFGGLSIEDCVLRSRAEWQRVSAPA